MSVYVSKDSKAYTITVQTNIDFTADAPASQKIHYKKPDETIGDWVATQVGGGNSSGQIRYSLADNDESLGTDGVWYFRAELIYSDKPLYTKWEAVYIGPS